MFITIDGCDGAGKTTQIALLEQWFLEQGRRVTVCRDPGGTALGENLRSILLLGWEIPIHPRSETLLYMASRSQLVEELIRPALERDEVVLSDRYILSNVVYQGYGFGTPAPRGCEPEWIHQLGIVAMDGVVPELGIVLDLPVDVTLERMRQMGKPLDRLESRGREYLERVREGFRRESRRDSRYRLIDAIGTVESVHKRILEVVVSHQG